MEMGHLQGHTGGRQRMRGRGRAAHMRSGHGSQRTPESPVHLLSPCILQYSWGHYNSHCLYCQPTGPEEVAKTRRP